MNISEIHVTPIKYQSELKSNISFLGEASFRTQETSYHERIKSKYFGKQSAVSLIVQEERRKITSLKHALANMQNP